MNFSILLKEDLVQKPSLRLNFDLSLREVMDKTLYLVEGPTFLAMFLKTFWFNWENNWLRSNTIWECSSEISFFLYIFLLYIFLYIICNKRKEW